MAQDFVPQVLLASVRINQPACLIFGNGINCQVAARQILFEGDGLAGITDKTFVAAATLTLGSCQGIFLFCPWMQEHGEVFAHGQITLAG